MPSMGAGEVDIQAAGEPEIKDAPFNNQGNDKDKLSPR
jgi:hypothetical protein